MIIANAVELKIGMKVKYKEVITPIVSIMGSNNRISIAIMPWDNLVVRWFGYKCNHSLEELQLVD